MKKVEQLNKVGLGNVLEVLIEIYGETIRTWSFVMFHLEHRSFDLLFGERCREYAIFFRVT